VSTPIINQRSWIEIDLSAFADNLLHLQRALLPQQKMLLVVKADAYGHGAIQIAQRAVKCGVAMLGVANVEEAIQLRIHRINKPILILSPSLDSECELIIEHDIVPSVSEIFFCRLLNEIAESMGKKIAVHLKIDTGMNRNGIKVDDLPVFLEQFAELNNLHIVGMFSHFASSDDDEAFSQQQYELFLQAVALLKSSEYSHINKYLRYIHIANSTAIFRQNYADGINTLPTEMNLVRVGIMSYGYYLDESLRSRVTVKPIMAFKSRVSHLGHAHAGETFGYNRTYTTTQDIQYAIVPVGYADGYDFLLSNAGCVYINGYLCPILGKISMDMLCVDITKTGDIQLYDEVLLLSGDLKMIDAKCLSTICRCPVHELLCQLGRRAQRYYFDNGQMIDNEPVARRTFIPLDFTTKKLNNLIQQSIAHRMQNNEVSNVLYRDVLRHYILESDRQIEYRSGFRYCITFSESDMPEYYKVTTVLSFSKVLNSSKFIVVCANDNERLQYFFRKKNCEYRWLLDPNLTLTSEHFFISKVSINEVLVKSKIDLEYGCIVYKYSGNLLKKLKGEMVDFCIESQTLYPRSSHSLTVYINELTKGVEVNFTYPDKCFDTETTTIFSGRQRFPQVEKLHNDDKTTTISVKTKARTWVIPNSAIVISFNVKDDGK